MTNTFVQSLARAPETKWMELELRSNGTHGSLSAGQALARPLVLSGGRCKHINMDLIDRFVGFQKSGNKATLVH